MDSNAKWSCFFIGMIFTLLSGCDFIGSGSEGKSNKPPLSPEELKEKLAETNWELRTVLKNGYGIYAPEFDSMYTLRFSENETLTGFDICNACFGDYHIDSLSNITFDGIGCTEKACHGFQHSIPFTTTLAGGTFPANIRDEQLYLTIEDTSEHTTTYAFSEYGTMKDVIMAKPASHQQFEFSEWPNSSYHSLEASLAGDSLTIEIGYSGCKPHELNLVVYEYFNKSNPVQASAFVAHTAEACRAVFNSTETFNLEPLKQAYQEKYGSSGSILLSIGRNGPAPVSVTYIF